MLSSVSSGKVTDFFVWRVVALSFTQNSKVTLIGIFLPGVLALAESVLKDRNTEKC